MTGKGRALKERHGTLLDDNIQVDDVYVLCRSVPRTIESVQCLLKGFFEQQKTPQVYVHRYAHNVLATTHPLQDDVVHLRSKVERAGLWQQTLALAHAQSVGYGHALLQGSCAGGYC
ncbi:hypothetical protein PRIC2_010028 [Phytophthora ramorum]